MAAPDRPILILATGQRCGSTWLQRILSTHPAVFIWGEHDGQLDPILTAADAFAAWCNLQGALSDEDFREGGATSFMANLCPGEDVLREQVGQLLRGLYRRLPDGTAPPDGFRWGFKEVRYGADFVRRFVRYFPGTRAVHLTRDPVSVLRSLDWWERRFSIWTREKTAIALARWRDINASFVDATDLDDTVLAIRYEEMKAEPVVSLQHICGFLDLDIGSLDLSVIDDVVHSPGPKGRKPRRMRDRPEIVAEFAEVLADPGLAEVAKRLGYRLDG